MYRSYGIHNVKLKLTKQYYSAYNILYMKIDTFIQAAEG